MQKTFDDLIRYLKKETPKKLIDAPDFELVDRFAKTHGINVAEIKDVFLGFGATCDDEWDATRIPENTKIGDEVEVPFDFCQKHDLFLCEDQNGEMRRCEEWEPGATADLEMFYDHWDQTH